jgi:hypothetical protein
MKKPILRNGQLLVTELFLENKVELDQALLDLEEIGDGMEFSVGDEFHWIFADAEMQEDVKDKDALYAEKIHRGLNIDRNTASNHLFWHFLTLKYGQTYVRKRFGDNTGKVKEKERFLGKWERNSLGRLWWWAELTSVDGNYKATRDGSVNQTFMMNILDITAGGSKRIVIKLIEKSFPGTKENLNEDQVKLLFKRLNVFLATNNIAVLNDDELGRAITAIISKVKAE